MDNDSHIILILRPTGKWGVVKAELKQVASLGRFMMVERAVKSERMVEAAQMRQLATACEELEPQSLYVRYANRKMFRHEKDFWACEDTTVRQHVKRMADRRLTEAIRLADELGIPMLYAAKDTTALHIDQRLRLLKGVEATPVMHFVRHDGGISYRLQLHMGEQETLSPSEHHITVLTYEPGLFIADSDIIALCPGFSGKLLLPFTTKAVVEIPQHMENEYFRKFILHNVAKADIHAEGFNIDDINEQPQPQLTVENAIDGRQLLSLSFRYGQLVFTPYSLQRGKVTLHEEDGTFRFSRLLRNMAEEQRYMELLHQAVPPQGITAHGEIRFATLQQLIDWLRGHRQALTAQGFDVVQPSDHVYHIGPLSVEQSESWHSDWLQTDVTIVLDEGRLRIPFADLRSTILRGEQDYMLPTGERLLIPEEWLQRYSSLLLMGRQKGTALMLHRSQLPSMPLSSPSSTPSPQCAVVSPPCPTALHATLRPYQLTGFQWLWQNFAAQTGCCLSDEMGLGKTLQTIALLLNYKETAKASSRPQPSPGCLFTDEEMSGTAPSASSVPGGFPVGLYRPSLVVAPASVVHNWQNELARFAPSLLVCNYTGDTTRRRDKRKTLASWDVVLTTYRTLQNDIAYLSRLDFGIVVFDESQAFKTATSQIHEAVCQLNALHRMALSGTPVENNLGELWSLMNVLNPELLGDWQTFQRSFALPIAHTLEEERTQLLRRLITPYFLKRTKEEVLTDLPERQDETIVCPMTDEQQHQYAEELSKARNEWMELRSAGTTASSARATVTMLAAITRLRMIANGEGKMQAVFEQLEQLRGTRHKVLIFSEYVKLLEHVAGRMNERGWQYDMLTGQTRQREQVIAHFQQTADCQFFLISLKAGGVGLNLTAADYVLLLDPWWNQAAEEQAIARAHRIGQHHPVFVYRYVAENTLEEQILTLSQRKQTLIDSVMPFICREE